MNIRLKSLTVSCKKSKEEICFSDFSYFYGRMGAGKSSIVRMIDYCFGGDLEMTPALQSELVSVGLSLTLEGTPVTLERAPESGAVRAAWTTGDDTVELLVPARTPAERPVFGKDVYVLSDLLFHLAKKTPPQVRRSKLDEESPLQRLSFRDLFWYCYLDQDTIDSSFFNLELDTNPFKKLKSLDVLRLLIGFHQAEVSKRQVRLQEIRIEKDRAEGALAAMRDALEETKVGSPLEVAARRDELNNEIAQAEAAINAIRAQTASMRSHALDEAQSRARKLSEALAVADDARRDAHAAIQRDIAHRNEIEFLSLRFKRGSTASAILRGVQFTACPKCTQTLPARPEAHCSVCGQADLVDPSAPGIDIAAVDADTAARIRELDELITRQQAAVRELDESRIEIADEKKRVDDEIARLSRDYDSVYLSNALELERHRASLSQELVNLARFEQILRRLDVLNQHLKALIGEEAIVRAEVKELQIAAERDATNLKRLQKLFLDSLLRAKIPGFDTSDVVEMKAPHFLPEITGVASGDLAVTSFSNLGSGGKKTLFKCCFAVAVHRLAAQTGALLPTLLIIDSPMKNISERENVDQFNGFYQMLFDLAQGELKQTQFIVVDKEQQAPPREFSRSYVERHMAPDDQECPPLISYYKGH